MFTSPFIEKKVCPTKRMTVRTEEKSQISLMMQNYNSEKKIDTYLHTKRN